MLLRETSFVTHLFRHISFQYILYVEASWSFRKKMVRWLGVEGRRFLGSVFILPFDLLPALLWFPRGPILFCIHCHLLVQQYPRSPLLSESSREIRLLLWEPVSSELQTQSHTQAGASECRACPPVLTPRSSRPASAVSGPQCGVMYFLICVSPPGPVGCSTSSLTTACL